MTVLDRRIPFVRVLMIMPRNTIYKEVPLHEDYHYVPYSEDLKDAWCKLQTEVGLFEDFNQAQEKLKSMLEEDAQGFQQNFLFVQDQEGDLVGSAGLWPGHDFDGSRTRIHFVAVKEKAQHKRIAQSLLTKLCLQYEEKPSKYPLYLVTQSQSYGAIALYSRLGFVPYLGEYHDHTAQESEKDWEIVTDILRQHAY